MQTSSHERRCQRTVEHRSLSVRLLVLSLLFLVYTEERRRQFLRTPGAMVEQWCIQHIEAPL